jgi:predicted MFS family arabinose efflux permease
VPFLAYASNFLWVMVIGLLGPSLPAVVADLGISYAQAGFFFTLLSLGSFFGTSIGAFASDVLPRKILYAGCALVLAAGLAALGFMPGYVLVALTIFLLSLFGSPIGAIGQSIMLGMFPQKRETNLSRMAFFAAVGSLVAPIIVTVNYSLNLSWHWPFVETAGLALILVVAIALIPLPVSPAGRQRQSLRTILSNRRVLTSAVLIFFSVAGDLGFSYWLAEYFKTELSVSLRLASSVVGIYLVGIIAGRLLVPVFLKRMKPETNIRMGLAIALLCIIAFILAPWPIVKAGLCVVYGFGIGPVFPLTIARGTREFPSQSGSVTGILFGCMSLGGMVFPLLVGALAQRVGISRSYWFCALVVLGLLVALTIGEARGKRQPA